MKGPGILMVGGGLASQRAAETLRARGYDGVIRILCGEETPPYDRPPLSKEVLAGKTSAATTSFRSPGWYADQRIELVDKRASGLDAGARRVRLADGTELRYEKLLVATGSAPRSLPALRGYSNVHFLRTVGDARRLRAELRAGARLAVVGAGFIGQEVAATARWSGAEVTMIEALPAPLGSVLGERIGRALIEMHSDEGVEVRLSSRLESARGNGAVEELELSGGEHVLCDAVVVGVGVAPDARWLESTPFGTGGVDTDEDGRTSLPDVFAAGDVTRSFDHRVGERRRSEHWEAAARQGAAAARAMLGETTSPAPPPSFWSDQYGSRIQYAGYAEFSDELTIEGRPSERRFSVAYTRAGRPVGVLAVNDPRSFARLRREIQQTWTHPREKEQS